MKRSTTAFFVYFLAAISTFAQSSVNERSVLFDNLRIEESSSTYNVHFKVEASGFKDQTLSVQLVFIDENGNMLEDGDGESCLFSERLTPRYESSEWKDYVVSIEKSRVPFNYSGRFGFYLLAYPPRTYSPIAKSKVAWFSVTTSNKSSSAVPISGSIEDVGIQSDDNDVLIQHKLALNGLKGRNVSLVYTFYDSYGNPLKNSNGTFYALDNVTPSYDGSTWKNYEKTITLANIPFSTSGKYGLNIEAYAPGKSSPVCSTPILWFNYNNNDDSYHAPPSSYASSNTSSNSSSSSYDSSSSSSSTIGVIAGIAAVGAAIYGLSKLFSDDSSSTNQSNSASNYSSNSSIPLSQKDYEDLISYLNSIIESYKLTRSYDLSDEDGYCYCREFSFERSHTFYPSTGEPITFDSNICFSIFEDSDKTYDIGWDKTRFRSLTHAKVAVLLLSIYDIETSRKLVHKYYSSLKSKGYE